MQANRRVNVILAGQSLSSGVSGGTISPIIATADAADAGIYANNGQSNSPVITVMVNTITAPTGTSPSVTYYLQVSVDGSASSWVSLPVNSGAITTTGVVRFVNTNFLEPFWQIIAVITGTVTPTFPSVAIDAFMTSPDS